MTATPDFARLTRNWRYWSGLGQLGNASESTECDDCAILFSSDEYSVHLRHDGIWWIVDTVDDRRQRHNDTAKLSTYALAEKYLTWMWASTARGIIGAPVLGPPLYALGFQPGVDAVPLSEGIFELRSPEGRAVLMEPYATIFSHLMDKSEEEIEQTVRAGA